MQLIELSLDHHKLYCPISGEPILEPEDVNRDAPSLVAYWVEMGIDYPFIKDEKLRQAWETWSDTEEHGVDPESLAKWLKKYKADPNWVVFEITNHGIANGPVSNTVWFVLDMNNTEDWEEYDGPR